MRDIKEFFARDRFAKFCGIEVMDTAPGRAKVRMQITDDHVNGLGVGHGGALYTMADFAFAIACNSHGQVAVAINVNMSYIAAAKKGMVYAEAVEEAKNPKLGNYTVRVTDEEGNLLALFTGLAYRKKQTLDEVE